MVSSRGVSAVVCVAIGLGCIVSVLKGHGGDSGARVEIAAARPRAAEPQVAETQVEASPEKAVPAVPLRPAPVAAASVQVDTSLPTGSIAPGSALHALNPAAYADAAKAGSSLIVTGDEAINYLAGNTLRREGSGEPLHFTYFAARGVMGEGSERGFTARRWDREGPDLCEPGPDGAPLCRTVSILLDAKSEMDGARLGTVTLGPRQGGSVPQGGSVQPFPKGEPSRPCW